MAEAEVVAVFRGIDALQDRTMFLFMLRCGLRVSEVSRVRWAALAMPQGTLRVNNSQGQVDRVVYPAMSRPPCGSGTASRGRRQTMSSRVG
jgi:integrase